MKTLRLHLTPDEHWRLPDAKYWHLHCDNGVLWISCRGDQRDYMLGAGQSLVLEQRQGVLVGAMGAASVRIDASRSPDLLARLLAVAMVNLAGIKS